MQDDSFSYSVFNKETSGIQFVRCFFAKSGIDFINSTGLTRAQGRLININFNAELRAFTDESMRNFVLILLLIISITIPGRFYSVRRSFYFLLQCT